MIEIQSIFIKNFLSSGSGGLKIELNKHPSTLIFGKNGNGKSLIIDALCFGLYNKSLRKVVKARLINSKNKKDCLVEICLNCGTKQVLVRRGIKPNIFEIHVDGVLINQSATNIDYDEYLETELLQMQFKSFVQMVVLGSKLYTPFMELKSAERRVIIDSLLDITVFTKMGLLLKDRAKLLVSEINNIESDILNLTRSKELHEKYISNIKKQNVEKSNSLSEQLVSYNDELATHENNIIQYTQQYDEIIGQLVDTSIDKQNLNKYIDVRAKMLVKKTNAKTSLKFYSTNDSCPTCKQEINNDFKSKLIDECNVMIEQVDEGLEAVAQRISNTETLINNMDTIQKKMNNIQSQIKYEEQSKKYVLENVKKLEQELQKITISGTIDTSVEEKEVEHIENELLKLQQELTILNTKKQHYGISGKMLKDDGIKTLAVMQYLPIINALINHYLEVMQFFVLFKFDENFEETIKSRQRDEFQYESFSEGEKMRINLAILFAFRKISELKNTGKCNLLIMDEILDGVLDDEGVQTMSRILNEFEGNNVLLISHNEKFQDKFSRSLNVIKKNDYTIIKEI